MKFVSDLMQNYAKTLENMTKIIGLLFDFFLLILNTFQKNAKTIDKTICFGLINVPFFEKINKQNCFWNYIVAKALLKPNGLVCFFDIVFSKKSKKTATATKYAKTIDKMICFELKNVPFSEKINKKLVLKLHCGKNITKTEWFGMFF